MFLPDKILEEKLLKMLAEDLGQGDVTTALITPPGTIAEAEIVANDSGIAAGIKETEILMKSLGLEVEIFTQDGERIRSGRKLIRVSGDAGAILSVERTVLNIMSRMSGIATMTRDLVERLRGAKLKVTLASTRKTAPGLMYFDKKAVLIGGGDPHRLHLDDMVLIKDNHIILAGSIDKAVSKVKEKVSFSKKIEVEVTNAEDALQVAEAGADMIMLDNFPTTQLRKTCALLRKTVGQKRILIEVSGGINSANIMKYASTGVDIVSLGEITDSPKALDISLEITKTRKKRP